MSNERILSFQKSKKLSVEQTKDISAAAGMTSYYTAHGSYNPAIGWDGSADCTLDL